MSNMETIIRPFQRPTTIADKQRQITTPVVVPPEIAIIVWGGAGQSPTMKVSGVDIKVKHNDVKMKEVRRTTRKIRVQNPDDPNQFIIEDRPEKLRLKTGPMAKQTDNSMNFTPSGGSISTPVNANNSNTTTGPSSGGTSNYYTEMTLSNQLGPNESQV